MDIKLDTKPDTLEETPFTKLVIKKSQLDIKLGRNMSNKSQPDILTPNTLLEDQVFIKDIALQPLDNNKSTPLVPT